ncbi:MAG: hypothetical protein WDN04_21270 [Rhodospirillales bacterium]
MKRNLRNILVATLLAAAAPLLAPAAHAQGMPMMSFGHHADRIAEKLKLSPRPARAVRRPGAKRQGAARGDEKDA